MFFCCENRATAEQRPADGPTINRGVGIVCHPDKHGRLLVHSLSPGGPAEKCGLLEVGDILMSIDGTQVSGMHVSMVAPLLVGEVGSTVLLGFRRADKEISVTLRRGWVPQYQYGPSLGSSSSAVAAAAAGGMRGFAAPSGTASYSSSPALYPINAGSGNAGVNPNYYYSSSGKTTPVSPFGNVSQNFGPSPGLLPYSSSPALTPATRLSTGQMNGPSGTYQQ